MITVLVPVLNRPDNVQPLINSFLANSRSTSSMLFIVQVDDSAEIDALVDALPDNFDSPTQVSYCVVPSAITRWSQKLNAAHRLLEDMPPPNDRSLWRDAWYLLGADDLAFHKGWDNNKNLDVLMHTPSVGVIGTNDLSNPAVIAGQHSTHPLMRVSYVRDQGIEEAINVIAPECYHHNYVDNELIGIALKRKAYAHCHESIVEHMHFLYNKGKIDSTYRLGSESARYHRDGLLFRQRAAIYLWPTR